MQYTRFIPLRSEDIDTRAFGPWFNATGIVVMSSPYAIGSHDVQHPAFLLALSSIHATTTLISQRLRTRKCEDCSDTQDKHAREHGLRKRTCLRTPYLSWKASRMLRSHKWKPFHASNTLYSMGAHVCTIGSVHDRGRSASMSGVATLSKWRKPLGRRARGRVIYGFG